jgi:hypothetical protein
MWALLAAALVAVISVFVDHEGRARADAFAAGDFEHTRISRLLECIPISNDAYGAQGNASRLNCTDKWFGCGTNVQLTNYDTSAIRHSR